MNRSSESPSVRAAGRPEDVAKWGPWEASKVMGHSEDIEAIIAALKQMNFLDLAQEHKSRISVGPKAARGNSVFVHEKLPESRQSLVDGLNGIRDLKLHQRHIRDFISAIDTIGHSDAKQSEIPFRLFSIQHTIGIFVNTINNADFFDTSRLQGASELILRELTSLLDVIEKELEYKRNFMKYRKDLQLPTSSLTGAVDEAFIAEYARDDIGLEALKSDLASHLSEVNESLDQFNRVLTASQIAVGTAAENEFTTTIVPLLTGLRNAVTGDIGTVPPESAKYQSPAVEMLSKRACSRAWNGTHSVTDSSGYRVFVPRPADLGGHLRALLISARNEAGKYSPPREETDPVKLPTVDTPLPESVRPSIVSKLRGLFGRK